ncbi:MAG: NAD(P)/FAD-dependent oxidoreductase [Candidatus Gracilibacteria bacterium]|jgi:flavin-dependent dehydrogenase|nr:NAD(P)/FAD-dependent oxidoreductase [Candidatus Gracilibacteria bacterium]
MYYDIVIIGAGFAGLSASHHLPKNLKILILDRKKKLDSHIESTGLITKATKELIETFFDPKPFLPNQITKIAVVGTDFRRVLFSDTKEPWIYSTDTPALLKKMSENLPGNVTLEINSVFKNLIREETEKYPLKIEYLSNGKLQTVRSKFLIGADGAGSGVAKKTSGLSQNKKLLVGFEKVFYGKIKLGTSPEKTVYHFWFGDFSLGYGGWLSPTILNGKPAFRLGLAKHMKDASENKLEEFIRILKEKNIIEIEKDTDEILSFTNTIPISGPLKNIFTKDTLLLGDAAGFCGAFAADGIKGAILSGIVASKLVPKVLQGKPSSLKIFNKEMQLHNKILTYYKKQLLYRFLWDRMKSNRSFDLLFDIINRDSENFINHFCDSRDKQKSLIGFIVKPKNYFLLIKYAVSIFLDFFKASSPRRFQ